MYARFFLCIAFVSLWIAPPFAAAANVSAILIGVSEYEDETGIADLKGPANDVRLLRDALAARGVSDVTILADGVDGGARPTRQAILSALSDAALNAAAGDFVFIHLSGHGTRQPDRNGDETDGLDEVFLPADTAHADQGNGLIRNAIVDDEIGAAVRALRAKGADVWLVMDNCHAGSGLRAANESVADRYVDPGLLGVGGAASVVTEATLSEASDGDLPGGVVAFYAAQSSEVAREVNMAAQGEAEAWFGLFSAKLAARLASGADTSFRQLFQAVLRDMNDQNVVGAARLQTPLWEGNLIDAAIFGGAGTVGVQRFQVSGDTLAAGLLHGIADGTLVALYADVADHPEAVLGIGQVEGAQATQSYLRPVSPACAPRGDRPCARAGDLPSEARFAQVLAQPADLVVTLAPPMDARSQTPLEEDHPVSAALAEAVALPHPIPVKLARTGHQVETLWDGTSLWFGPRTMVGDTPVGLSWTPSSGDLGPLITRIARAEQLARLIAPFAGQSSLLNPSPVEIAATFAPVAVADLQPADAGISPMRECQIATANRGAAPDVPLPPGAAIKQCDGVSFAVRGLVPGARDVNRVHIDAQYCIHASHERIEGASAPRKLGPDMTICSDCPGGYSAGAERLFVIVSEARPNAEALNLEGLVENCGTSGGTRGTGDVNDFFRSLSVAQGTRGNMGTMSVSDIWVEQRNWTVLPKPQAFARAGRE